MTGRAAVAERLEILIAEDSATQAEHLRTLLEANGYSVTHAADGAAALEAARQRPPALVISDVLMPGLDGYGLCRAVKSDRRLEDVPVVLVTTLSDPQDIVRGLECRADNFIRKPYDERELISRVEYLLMNRELRREQTMQPGIEVTLGGAMHVITAERQQILDMLISTYEQAVDLNEQLSARQRELATANAVLAGMYGLAQGLNRETSEGGVAATALERATELQGVTAGWIVLHDGGASRIVSSRGLRAPIDPSHLEPAGDVGTVTTRVDFRYRSGAHGLPQALRYGARVPLRLGDRTVGLMNLLGADERAFDAAACKALDGVGRQVAVALERSWLHANLERRVEERTRLLIEEIVERERQEARVARLNRIYSVLSGINAAIVRVRDRDALFRRACRIAVDDGRFAFAWIGTLDEERLAPRAWAAAGDDEEPLAVPDLAALTGPEACGLMSSTVGGGELLISNDIAGDPRLVRCRAEALARGYRSVVALPLRLEQRPAGTLMLYAVDPDAFDDDEMRLLTETADAISFAMEHISKDQRLHRIAFFDSVTGLPNRARLLQDLAQALLEAGRNGTMTGVGMLDLDRFKVIVDSLGHPFGDRFLEAVGARLARAAPAEATVARLAGDEFAVVLAGLRQPQEAAAAAEALLTSLTEPITVDSHELYIGASLGIALSAEDARSEEDLLRNAEVAMYRAKGSGGGYQLFEAGMAARADERLALEIALRHALDKHQFLLHYQPVVSLATGALVGVEALVRWQSDGRGLVPPGEFIPLAEETGLIVRLGEWVLEEACSRAHGSWRSDQAPPLQVAVNVSPRQFHQPDLVERVTTIVSRTGLDPTRLTLEITESHLMRNIDSALAAMRTLAELGIRFSIDDFGAGYSSLAYLSHMPLANLKIDRSFVRSIPGHENDATIVTTMISMAHNLGIQVVAEGVETDDQVAFLRSRGCDAAQGYYFGRPVPAGEIDALVSTEA